MTLTTKRGMSIETPYTHDEALTKLRDVPGAFAADLANKRTLSPDQLAWAHKLVIDHEAKAGRPAPKARTFKRIVALFAHALEHKAYPKIRLTLPSGATLKMQLCGPKSKYHMSINVTDGGSYPDNKFWGRIGPGGAYSFEAPAEVLALLDAFDSDPAAVAKTQGENDCVCVFCQKELDTLESRSVGYGPVCAKSYGLPWNAATNRTAPRPRKARKAIVRRQTPGIHDPARDAEESSRYVPSQPGDEMFQLADIYDRGN